MSKPHRFIAIEGLDGSGKTTVAQKLVRALTNSTRIAKYFRDPGSSTYAERLRTLLLDPSFPLTTDQQIVLFSACRRQLATDIKSFLDADPTATAVVDRWFLSTLVYQGRDSESLLTVHAMHRALSGFLEDPLTIVLDVPVVEAQRRLVASGRPADRFEAETEDMERRRHAYLSALCAPHNDLRLVHADRDPDEVFDAVLDHVFSFDRGSMNHG